MQLSEHFSEAEFVRSELAARRHIVNVLPADLLPEAQATAGMLERIRARLSLIAGREVPIYLSSGYRCLPLNRALGSADTSHHVLAAAADWTAPEGPPSAVTAAPLRSLMTRLDRLDSAARAATPCGSVR